MDYRVLIADDEKGFCNLLEKSINQMDGYRVVGKAYDGLRATELVQELCPDILITDINMPKLSGLDLLRRVQQINREIETLVVSGYSEFSYAKTAMALGVNDYLLKPFLPDELQEVLNKMSAQIETRKTLAENLRQLQQEVDAGREEQRSRFLLRLVTGEPAGAPQELVREGAALGIALDQKMYCVCVARIRPAFDHLLDMVQNNYFSEQTVVYGAIPDDKTTVLVLGSSADSEFAFYKDIEAALGRITHSLAAYYNTRLWCSVGNIYHSVEEIAVSYREAYTVWRSKLTEDEALVCYDAVAGQQPADELKRPIELENRLLRLIQSADEERAVICLRQIMDHYAGYCLHNMEFVSLSLVKLVFAISEVVSKANNGKVAEDTMVLDYLKHHFARSSMREAATVLETYVRGACMPFRTINVEHSDKLIFALKDLIEKNLSDENFSLESAAGQLYFSSNYIRQLFKQKVGESFIEYLIRRRMETARSLLVDSTMQIQKIAEETGYSNARYFASCFKKYYGCTPTECRAGAPAVHPPKGE